MSARWSDDHPAVIAYRERRTIATAKASTRPSAGVDASTVGADGRVGPSTDPAVDHRNGLAFDITVLATAMFLAALVLVVAVTL